LTLGSNEVHIWQANLDQAPADLDHLWELLQPDEHDRAARFRFPRDKRRFVARRGLLREILSAYTGEKPAALRLVYGQFGKPSLAPSSAAADVHFNLSHSAGLVLYAVASKREVGIDTERIVPGALTQPLVERLMSPAEISVFQQLTPSAQCKAFFDCWTRKEAYLKGLGVGLQVEPNSFAVSLKPSEPATLLEGTDHRWSLQALGLADDYSATVAAEGRDWSVTLLQWSWNPNQKLEVRN
jgi:4'-phosphopantetheinyl transferase